MSLKTTQLRKGGKKKKEGEKENTNRKLICT